VSIPVIHSESLSSTLPGLLLIGHGTRSQAGVQQFLDIAATLGARAPEAIVEPAFLELAEPNISAAVTRLCERGARTIVVVPFLLAAADHVKEDIPAAVKAAVANVSHDLSLIFAEHLGSSAAVLELSTLRYREAVENLPHVAPEATCHLLVGRGTHDSSAIAEVTEFARLLADVVLVGETRLAFLAMAQPSLAEELQRIAATPFERVVVQPHLLFEGDLADSVGRQVAKWAGQQPERQWLTTAVLADPVGKPKQGAYLLAEAAYERFGAGIRVVGPE
jgi:sirohydrochlorin cobaltochelatase